MWKDPVQAVVSARWLWVTALAFFLPLAACDSDPTGTAEGHAVVVGSVESSQAAAASSGDGPTAASGEARTVAIGRITSAGAFQSMAEAEVDASGSFRIEGVPSGHANLVVVARGEADAEVGRAVLHAETRAGAEHRAHPINANSTLHARVWARMISSGAGSQAMGPAELALFVHADASAAAGTHGSDSQVDALAAAAVQAQIAMSTILASGEAAAGLDGEARAQLLADLAAQRDRSRHEGASAEATQRAFASAALDLFQDEGVRAEALGLAYAAATTGLDRAMIQAAVQARLDIAREAVLLNLESRQRAAAEVEADGLGIRSAVLEVLAETEAQVAAAGSMTQLKAALESSRVQMESRVLARIETGLSGLPLELLSQIRTQAQAALAEARLWTALDGAASGEALAQAAVEFRAQAEAAAEAFVADLPSEAQAQISTEVMAALLVALGAGPHCH